MTGVDRPSANVGDHQPAADVADQPSADTGVTDQASSPVQDQPPTAPILHTLPLVHLGSGINSLMSPAEIQLAISSVTSADKYRYLTAKS